MTQVGYFLFALLTLAVIASGIGVVYERHQGRVLFAELTRLTRERDEMNFEYGRLQLEQSTLAEPNRIEQVARGQLGMDAAPPAAVVIIRR
ncbi:cell division protein FtsL [Tahibacter amnicola]|uniref:Cell division protein FtsL n=1 Tax=Tahibacter amnicola TaxID=2976241 RepID=A0ABY6BCE6_9GAMM|nr:cell division protein FtsL [Tahibacter amnicola]UXI67718.1 cell division protein FtsL [Tahibacter amnicola]